MRLQTSSWQNLVLKEVTNKDMSKIGVMGGTFDPCHRGHINLALDAKKQANLDKVILMPAKIQPFKQDKDVTEAFHRVNMLKEAVKNIEGLDVSTLEVDKDGISYTYETLEEIKAICGEDSDIYFISGTDAFLSMETWKQGDEMLQRNKFVVGVRPGYKESQLNDAIAKVEGTYGTCVIKIDNKRFHISSTDIRNRLKENQTIEDLVTAEVERYIRENGLYI